MPSLFSRRRASSQPPRPTPPPSLSATIAASNAFLQSSTSNASLSSAAAAAALRSHTTSPEPIGSIQTKRMARRGSQSSVSSSVIARQRQAVGRDVQRRDSNSSMSERTFRSPSPGRSGAVPPAVDAPPVPAVPKSARRSASLEPTTSRMTSPSPRKGGRNGSVEKTNNAAKERGSTSGAMPMLTEVERENSQRSVNFSRPMSPAPAAGQSRSTPAAQARPQSTAGWFTAPAVGSGSPRSTVTDRPKSAGGLSAVQAQHVERELQQTATNPVAKKKKKATVANEGERPMNGTMHAGPTGTAVAPAPRAPPAKSTTTTTTTTTSQVSSQASDTDTSPVKKKKKDTPPVNTQIAPDSPSRGSARFTSSARDGAWSPPSPRAAGMLHKQPSVVREDPEAEDMAERDPTSMRSQAPQRTTPVTEGRRVVSTFEAPAKTYTAPGGRRSASLDIPREPSSRNASSSPQRIHAHFSDVIVDTPASKHQPPPRSVSPFKSALKHSPSSSVRGNSPVGPNGTRVPGSDASDTTSLASQDGINSAKKKKGVRVSFDDSATTVVPPILVASSNISNPIRRELSPAAATDSDNDEVMTPRPALPSFGSVRGRKPQSPDVAEKVTETLPFGAPASVATDLPGRSGVTSDHALDAIVANDHAEKLERDRNAPLPPQVTSVEGSGYVSDSSSSDEDSTFAPEPLTNDIAPEQKSILSSTDTKLESNGHARSATSRSKDEIVESVVTAPAVESISPAEAIDVPNIHILPATPGTEDDKPILDSPGAAVNTKRYSMPGGWEELEDSKSDSTLARPIQAIATEEPDFESSDEDDSLDAPEATTEHHSPNLDPIYESDSDSSDAFSDAAEDFDGGFASLDAVVESPVQGQSPARDVSTPNDSRPPPPKQPAMHPSPLSANAPGSGIDGGWTEATAYWSSLTRETKEQMERQAQPQAENAPVVQQPSPKKRDQAPTNIPLPTSKPLTQPQPLESPLTPRSLSEQPDSRFPILRTSMRSPPPAAAPAPAPPASNNETHLRKSMRSGGSGAGGMKSSMRPESAPKSANPEPRGALQKKRIPTTATVMASGSTGAAAAAVRNAPLAPSARAAIIPADDSDSESSFKKKRRRGSASTVDSSGRYNMKRSMRASSVDQSSDRRPISPTPAPRGSAGLSIRSLSPNGSFMGRNRDTLRTSLRGGPVDDTPTLRGKNSKAQNSKAMRDSKSPSRFSMSGFSKATRPTSSNGPTRDTGRSRTFKSRFNDSDDSDDDATMSRGGFRSRFADSDDEDSPIGPPRHMPANLAPVRGIPKQQDRYEEDSTDLEDSDEEVQAQPNSTGTKRASERNASKPGVPSQADIDAAMEIARRNVAAMNGGRPPGVLPNGDSKKHVTVDPEPHTNGVHESQPPATPTKRRGFLGSMLGRRRTSSVASVPQLPTMYAQSPAVSVNTQSPSGKLQRKSTARTNSHMSGMPAAPQTHEGMLAEQPKATTPGAASTNSQNWPLPPPDNAVVDADRPATSDGADPAHFRTTMRNGEPETPARPAYKRRSLSGGDIDRLTKNAVYSERTGKKKRFGLLRRAFGLND